MEGKNLDLCTTPHLFVPAPVHPHPKPKKYSIRPYSHGGGGGGEVWPGWTSTHTGGTFTFIFSGGLSWAILSPNNIRFGLKEPQI
jgi:hypothetical protein